MKDRAEARERDLHREISNLSDSLRRQKEHEADTVRSYEWKIGNFVNFFPDAVAMLPAIEECQDVGLNDNSIKGLLSMNEYVLKSGTTLYYPFQRREVDASGAKVQIKRDPGGQQIPSPCQWHPDIPMAQRPMAAADTDGKARLRN